MISIIYLAAALGFADHFRRGGAGRISSFVNGMIFPFYIARHFANKWNIKP